MGRAPSRWPPARAADHHRQPPATGCARAVRRCTGPWYGEEKQHVVDRHHRADAGPLVAERVTHEGRHEGAEQRAGDPGEEASQSDAEADAVRRALGTLRRRAGSLFVIARHAAILRRYDLPVIPLEARMDPMFLPGVESSPNPDSPYTRLIEEARAAGREYPKIWHLFAFKPHATQHLAHFTQEILRGEAPLSPGFRELIAVRTSGRNDCPF